MRLWRKGYLHPHTLGVRDYTIQAYWGQVTNLLMAVGGKHFNCDIKLALLNVWGPTDLGSKERTWATLGLMVAKRNIVRLWVHLSHRKSRIGATTWIGAWLLRGRSTWLGVVHRSGHKSGQHGIRIGGNICEPPRVEIEEEEGI